MSLRVSQEKGAEKQMEKEEKKETEKRPQVLTHRAALFC